MSEVDRDQFWQDAMRNLESPVRALIVEYIRGLTTGPGDHLVAGRLTGTVPLATIPTGPAGYVLTGNGAGTASSYQTAGSTTYGTPALTLGTVNAAGTVNAVIRRDATILTFDATAPVTQAFSDAAAVGSASVAARRDHKHGMPAAPATGMTNPMTTEGDLIQGGASGTPARLALGTALQRPVPIGADVGWATDGNLGGALDPTTTDGDLLYRKATTVATLGVGYIGDSITGGLALSGGTPPAEKSATDLSLGSVTVTATNQGLSGATTADWVPGAGSGYLTTAKAAFAGAGVRLVHVMLGTNDSKTAVATSAAAYRANLLALCQDLVSAGYLVALSYPTYLVTTSGQWDAGSEARIAGYLPQIDSLVDNAHVFLADTTAHVYFKTTPAAMQVDGIHPTQAGSDTLARFWANALQRVVNGLTGTTVWQRLALGSGLAISGGVLSGSASPRWEPLTNQSVPDLIFTAGGDVVACPN